MSDELANTEVDIKRGEPNNRDDLSITTFTWQTVTEDEVEALVDLMLARRQEYYPGDPLPLPADVAARIRAPEIEGSDSLWVLATAGGRPQGFASWNVAVDDNPHIVWLSVYVHPECRRRGVGKRLLARTLSSTDPRRLELAGFCVPGHVPVGQQIQRLVAEDWGLAVNRIERGRANPMATNEASNPLTRPVPIRRCEQRREHRGVVAEVLEQIIGTGCREGVQAVEARSDSHNSESGVPVVPMR